MAMNRRSLFGLGIGLLVSACAYPVAESVQTTEKSSIYFTGDIGGVFVTVDGIDAGAAVEYDGVDGVLVVTPGTHQLNLRRNGSVFDEREIFVGRGQRLEIDI